MKKVVHKILLLVAVITVSAHSTFPHIHLDEIMAFVEDHHHDEQSAGNSHDDNTDNNIDAAMINTRLFKENFMILFNIALFLFYDQLLFHSITRGVTHLYVLFIVHLYSTADV